MNHIRLLLKSRVPPIYDEDFEEDDKGIDEATLEEITVVLLISRNEKTPGEDGINMVLIKRSGDIFI